MRGAIAKNDDLSFVNFAKVTETPYKKLCKACRNIVGTTPRSREAATVIIVERLTMHSHADTGMDFGLYG